MGINVYVMELAKCPAVFAVICNVYCKSGRDAAFPRLLFAEITFRLSKYFARNAMFDRDVAVPHLYKKCRTNNNSRGIFA